MTQSMLQTRQLIYLQLLQTSHRSVELVSEALPSTERVFLLDSCAVGLERLAVEIFVS